MSVRLRKWKSRSGKVLEAWWIDVKFQHADGRIERVRKASPVNTRRGAEQYERDLRQSLLSGKYGKEEKPVPTLAEFAKDFLAYCETNNKPSTLESRKLSLRKHIVPALGHLRMDRIGPVEMERYKVAKLKPPEPKFNTRENLEAARKKKKKSSTVRPLSPKSINHHIGIIVRMINLAVEWEVMPPIHRRYRKLKLPELEFVFLDPEEVPRFLRATPKEWLPMMTVALKTGLRLGELLALRWEDVDLVAAQLMVRRSLWRDIEGPPKSGKKRAVPLSRDTVTTLKEHRALHGPLKSPYVFSGPDGRRLAHNAMREIVPRICRQAGLAKRLTMHDLRHSFASHLVMAGRSLKEVQELLGHATIDMTMRYAHLSRNKLLEAVSVLDQLTPAEGSAPAGAHTGHIGA